MFRKSLFFVLAVAVIGCSKDDKSGTVPRNNFPETLKPASSIRNETVECTAEVREMRTDETGASYFIISNGKTEGKSEVSGYEGGVSRRKSDYKLTFSDCYSSAEFCDSPTVDSVWQRKSDSKIRTTDLPDNMLRRYTESQFEMTLVESNSAKAKIGEVRRGTSTWSTLERLENGRYILVEELFNGKPVKTEGEFVRTENKTDTMRTELTRLAAPYTYTDGKETVEVLLDETNCTYTF